MGEGAAGGGLTSPFPLAGLWVSGSDSKGISGRGRGHCSEAESALSVGTQGKEGTPPRPPSPFPSPQPSLPVRLRSEQSSSSKTSLPMKPFLIHHPTPPPAPREAGSPRDLCCTHFTDEDSEAQAGRDAAVCTAPEVPRRGLGPRARVSGPRPGSVGSTQAQRAEVVNTTWCPKGA